MIVVWIFWGAFLGFNVGMLVVIFMGKVAPKENGLSTIKGEISMAVWALFIVIGIASGVLFSNYLDSMKVESPYSNSSMTKQEKRLANEAGYVEKDGKWYYQGNGNR